MERPLVVIALGGNAISPPAGDGGFAAEAAAVESAAAELAAIARLGKRLLIVHGNGPQVGRLLAAAEVGDAAHLDVHVAQTQGEIGYQIAAALDRSLGVHGCVALITRVLVAASDPAFGCPTKPVGRILSEPTPGVACRRTPDGRGWRRVVASPRPIAVVERDAIAALVVARHVVAGGGGGIALVDADGMLRPAAAVVDKDWTAARLAIELDAEELVFVTDVACAYDRFASPARQPLRRVPVQQARTHLETGTFAPGSMAPKIESAIDYVEATGRTAVITTPGMIDEARAGRAGTAVVPDAGAPNRSRS